MSTETFTTPAPYIPPENKPPAILVDVDGTVAIMNGRSPFDETRVHEDTPNRPVILVIAAMARTHRIIFMSGRTEACRQATESWLHANVPIPFHRLYMRQVGDFRKDAIIKAELFDRHIRDNYRVRFVLDDRNQVVEMWRSIGLTVFQVANGDF